VAPLIGSIGWQEVILIAAVVFILFGATRIPMAFRSLGEGLRSFKEGLAGPEEAKAKSDGGKKQASASAASTDERGTSSEQ